jgi:hypothetical protein
MKVYRAVFATLIFVFFLLFIYTIHVNYLRINVLFYAAIMDGVLAALATGLMLFLVNYFNPLNKFEKFQLFTIWMLAGYSFAISGPTVIDRSLSFYILEKLQQRGGGIALERFEEVFTKEYINEHRLMDVRLTEQEQSGTITITDGWVRLTKRGDQIATCSRLFRHHFLPKKRLLRDQYSDDLIDPFRNRIKMDDLLNGAVKR